MRARMSRLAVLSVLVLAAACGKEIGDECSSSLDCGDGTNQALVCDTTSPGGYCTEQGCDWNTCPEEAVCVRFYAASFGNKPCDLAAEDLTEDRCTLDEVCTLKGQCVPRTSEVRYCMRTCDDDAATLREHRGADGVPAARRRARARRAALRDEKFCAGLRNVESPRTAMVTRRRRS
jgi:hypothetical protein